MNRFLFLLLVCMAIASPVMSQDQSATLRAAAGCGPADAQFTAKVDKNRHAIAKPEPGKALVYVIAQENPEDSYNIGDITTRVGLHGAWVGANYGESYILFSVRK
jgi:hypothetical protein